MDSYAQKIDNFSMLLLQARNIMIEKSETLESENEAVEVKQRQYVKSTLKLPVLQNYITIDYDDGFRVVSSS